MVDGLKVYIFLFFFLQTCQTDRSSSSGPQLFAPSFFLSISESDDTNETLRQSDYF